MFKLERQEFVNKTFRLPLSLVEELQALAQCKNMRSAILRRMTLLRLAAILKPEFPVYHPSRI